MSYHLNFSNHQIFGTYIFVPWNFGGKTKNTGVKPPTVKADHNRGTQGNYFDPWPLQQFLSRVFQNDGVDGWMAWKQRKNHMCVCMNEL